MSAQERFRYRVHFHKTEAMRFTGHLDLYRTLERAIRRAGIPLAYRGGFSPHPRLQLAAALPLGLISRAAIADVWLEQPLEEKEMLARLQSATPPGLRFLGVRSVEANQPALQEQIVAATYSAHLLEPPPADLEECVTSLLSASSLVRQRRGKSYDLRPLIGSLQVIGHEALLMQLSAREGATGRPEEVLDALGLHARSAQVERISLTFASSQTT